MWRQVHVRVYDFVTCVSTQSLTPTDAAQDSTQGLGVPWRPDEYVLDYHLHNDVSGPDMWRRLSAHCLGGAALTLTADPDYGRNAARKCRSTGSSVGTSR